MALADNAEQPLVAVREYSYWFMFAQHLEARSVGLVPEAVQDFIPDGLLQPLARECTNERDEGRKCSVIVQLIIQSRCQCLRIAQRIQGEPVSLSARPYGQQQVVQQAAKFGRIADWQFETQLWRRQAGCHKALVEWQLHFGVRASRHKSITKQCRDGHPQWQMRRIGEPNFPTWLLQCHDPARSQQSG